MYPNMKQQSPMDMHQHMPLLSGHLMHTTLTCTGKCPPVTCRISVENLCASKASLDLLHLSYVLLNIQISG